MNAVFYITAVVALAATVMAITRANAVHALLYLIVSLLAVALVFYTLGAAFAAALEIIVYAGAIMVLFVFVVMMLNLGGEAAARERAWLKPGTWAGPALLAIVLAAELVYVLGHGAVLDTGARAVGAKQVGIVLVGPYLLAVELGSLLLLAGLVAAYHVARDALQG
jgi:NADH-quinone oxidoreductase subunit J